MSSRFPNRSSTIKRAQPHQRLGVAIFFFRHERHHTFEQVVLRDSDNVNENYHGVKAGLYDVHFAKWLEYFPRDQMLVLDAEDFKKDPFPILKKVEVFLGLKPYIQREHVTWSSRKKFYCPSPHGIPKCLGTTKGRKHPDVSNRTMKIIQDFYRPHNRVFEQLVDHKFDWP